MSEHDDPIESLLAGERNAPGMPDEVSARLASRLGILAGPGGGGPTNGGGSSSGGGAAAASATATAARTWTAARAAQLGLVFVLGAASGAVLDRTLGTSPDDTRLAPAVVVQHEVVEEPIRPQPVPPPPTPTAVEPAIEVPAPSAPPARGPEDDGRSSDAERLWLERAEAAFGSGDASATLSALEAHARRFPHGRLSEERDALRVRALYFAGRREEADSQAERFAATYPSSVFSRQIERARGRAVEQTHTPETDP